MSAKFFLDTNILLYSFDKRNPKKIERSRNLLRQALQEGLGCISTQVVQEFLNVITKKAEIPLKLKDAKSYLKQVLWPICEVYPSERLYDYAIDIREKTRYSFYDAMIISSAYIAGCNVLYSEDLHHNHKIQNLVILNPFKIS